MPDVGAPGSGQPLEGGKCGFRIELAAVGHVQDLPVEPDAAPPFAGLGRVQELGADACSSEGCGNFLWVKAGSMGDDAGARQQLLAAFLFQFLPQRQPLGQHGHIVRLVVARVQVPGGAVGRTDLVAGAELLHQRHLSAPAR